MCKIMLKSLKRQFVIEYYTVCDRPIIHNGHMYSQFIGLIYAYIEDSR